MATPGPQQTPEFPVARAVPPAGQCWAVPWAFKPFPWALSYFLLLKALLPNMGLEGGPGPWAKHLPWQDARARSPQGLEGPRPTLEQGCWELVFPGKGLARALMQSVLGRGWPLASSGATRATAPPSPITAVIPRACRETAEGLGLHGMGVGAGRLEARKQARGW